MAPLLLGLLFELGVVVDRAWGYQVELPRGWQEVPQAQRPPEVLVAWTDARSRRLAVISKVPGPSDEPPSLHLVEGGIKAKAHRYRRLSARRRSLGEGRKVKIAAWDLWFRLERDGRPVTMGARFLFYRSYALSILVDLPGPGGPTAEARRLLESFVPPPPE